MNEVPKPDIQPPPTSPVTPPPKTQSSFLDSLIMPSVTKQLRIGLMAAPGLGKTTAALTFPNPLVLDFDHNCPKGTRTIPFWDANTVNKLAPSGRPDAPPDVVNALLNFLNEAKKLPTDTTLILDSWTALQNMIDIRNKWILANDKNGNAKDNKFAFWDLKKGNSVLIAEAFKKLPHTIVITYHEAPERNEDDVVIGIKPLQQGSFRDEIGAHITDLWRIVVNPPGQPKGRYFQVVPDARIALKTNHDLGKALAATPFHLATYESIRPYV